MENERLKQDILNELRQFTGTECYHEHKMLGFGFLHLTDGVAFLRERCNCRWLIDIVLSAQRMQKKVAGEEFQEWQLKKTKKENWVVKCTDGNKNLLYHLIIPFSDFPMDSVVIWYDKNVLLLPSEY